MPNPIPAGFGFGNLVDTGQTVPFPAEEPATGSPGEGVSQSGFGHFLDVLTAGANAGANVVNAVKGNKAAKPVSNITAPRTLIPGLSNTVALAVVLAVVLVVAFVFLRKK